MGKRVYLDATLPAMRKAARGRSDDVSAATVEIGTSGLRASGGGGGAASWIHDDSRPLSYAQRISLYREMGRTPVFGAGMFIFRALLAGIAYRVQPRWGSADPTLKLRADFARDVLADMGTQVELVMHDAWSSIQFGLSPFEVIYKSRAGDAPGTFVDSAGFTRELPTSRASDGLIGIDRLAYRAPGTVERWLLDANMGVRGMVQRDPNTGRELTLPAWKMLRHTFGSGSNPLGESAFDPCLGVYQVWKRLVESEAIGATRRLAGTPIVTVPETWLANVKATDTELTKTLRACGVAFEQTIRNWHADPNNAIMIPWKPDERGNQQISVKLIGIDGDAGMDTNEIITRHELRMGSALLASMIFLGQATGGTQALAREQSALLRNCLNALAYQWAAAFSRQVFGPLMRLNGWSESEAPELIAAPITETPTFEQLSAGIAAMANAGFAAPPDSVLFAAWRSAAGIDPAAPGEGQADLNADMPTDARLPADPIGEKPPGGLPPVGAVA